MTLKIADGQLGQRFVAGDGGNGRYAFVEQRVGVLLAIEWAAADQGLEFGVHEDVGSALAGGGHTGGGECLEELRTGERTSVFQRFGEEFQVAREGVGIEFQPAGHVGIERVHARGGGLEQPADVGRGDEVPGGAEDVRAEDVAAIEGVVQGCAGGVFDAQPEAPFGAVVVLRLDGAKPGDGLLGTGQRRAGEVLVGEPVGDEVSGFHGLRIADCEDGSCPHCG